MIECKDIEYILAIAKHKSISDAARNLFISQPALSKYLQSLESRLGVLLFDRSRKQIAPTAIGRTYISYASEMSEIKNHLEMEIERAKNESLGTLKVAFSCTGLREIIYKAIDQLGIVEPALKADFRNLTSPEIENLVRNYQIELGLISLPCSDPDLQVKVLLEEPILLCIPASDPLTRLGKHVKGSPYLWMDLSKLANKPFILHNEGTRFRTLTNKLFEEYDITNPNINMTSRDHLTTIEFANSYSLCFFIVESFIKSLKDPDQFCYFLVGTQPPKHVVGAIHRRGEALSIPARRLLDVIDETLSRHKAS